VDEWTHNNGIPQIYAIYSFNFIDFSSQDDSFKKSVTMTHIGKIKPDKKYEITIPLSLHEVELADAIYDPLGFSSEGFQFISATKESEISTIEGKVAPNSKDLMTMSIDLNLNGYLRVDSRTRYNVWDLLGDVGGLHDGLVIFFAIFVVPFSTFSFSNDFIEGKLVDGGNKKHDRAV